MKASNFFVIMTFATLTCAVPAGATETSTAVRLCEQNPNCNMHDGNDSIIMTVKGIKGGKSVVVCPMPNGTCIVERTASRVDARIEAMLLGGTLPMATTDAGVDASVVVKPAD